MLGRIQNGTLEKSHLDLPTHLMDGLQHSDADSAAAAAGVFAVLREILSLSMETLLLRPSASERNPLWVMPHLDRFNVRKASTESTRVKSTRLRWACRLAQGYKLDFQIRGHIYLSKTSSKCSDAEGIAMRLALFHTWPGRT